MKLSRFIVDQIEDILAEWVAYAGSLSPAADSVSAPQLRDHGEAMLRAAALDIDTPQSAREPAEKSLGDEDDQRARTAACRHGNLRQAANFTLLQLSSEFRGLRASVLRRWLRHMDTMSVGRPGRCDPVQRGHRPGAGWINRHLFGPRRAVARPVWRDPGA